MSKLDFNVVIPARFASTRLPGKPLRLIAGKPMIVRVCERAEASGAQAVWVATDDTRIATVVEEAGYDALLTRPDHQNGAERIAEVVTRLDWPDETLVVNLQGDEPLMPSRYLAELASHLAGQTRAHAATLAAPFQDVEALRSPHAVKVVLDHQHYALYFSRAPVPWHRDGWSWQPESLSDQHWRHIGLYAYTAGFLRRYAAMGPSPLERLESLEQLRLLWYGEAIAVKIVHDMPEGGVDTEADLQRVDRLLTRS